jgi:formylglycine-generating enzyme required for sulfatase activity
MKNVFVALALLAGIHQADAQGAQFFRISGPTATTVIAFNPDGTLVWSNGQSGATYTVQTVSSLPGGTNWVDYAQLTWHPGPLGILLTNIIFGFKPPSGMALIPEGMFTMGDTLDGESDATPTNIDVSAFYMDTNLVSYSQWQTVYSYATSQGYGFDNAGSGKAANYPVETVDWYDTLKWCNARSQLAGLTPVYYTDSGLTQVYTTGDTDAVYVNWGASGYRLPTEAEWEKAARGGLSGQRFPWGDTISWSQANYFGDPGSLGGFPYDLSTAIAYDPAFSEGDNGDYPYTSPVGYFAANGYGLHDMAGNVEEWCWDWYGTPYGKPTTTNPTGPASGSFRVLRGGSWYQRAEGVWCAIRFELNPGSAVDNNGATFGFRCVRGL